MVKKACGKARGVRESASWQVEITMASRRGIKKMISENVGISKRKESRTHMQLDLFFFWHYSSRYTSRKMIFPGARFFLLAVLVITR
jgi:hypothetical protein